MSPLFALKLSLAPSADYRRLGFILLALGFGGLYYANPPLLVLCFILCAYGCALYQLIRSPYPHPPYKAIRYHQEQWLIEQTDGSTLTYEKLSIALDTGFFLLLKFYGAKRSKAMVIFYDQIPRPDLQKLHILHTVL